MLVFWEVEDLQRLPEEQRTANNLLNSEDIVRNWRFGVKLVEIVHDNNRQPVIPIAVMVAALQLTASEL